MRCNFESISLWALSMSLRSGALCILGFSKPHAGLMNADEASKVAFQWSFIGQLWKYETSNAEALGRECWEL